MRTKKDNSSSFFYFTTVLAYRIFAAKASGQSKNVVPKNLPHRCKSGKSSNIKTLVRKWLKRIGPLGDGPTNFAPAFDAAFADGTKVDYQDATFLPVEDLP